MPLEERVYFCQRCGVSIDRDLNAALNLENAPKTQVKCGKRGIYAGGQVRSRLPWWKQEANVKTNKLSSFIRFE